MKIKDLPKVERPREKLIAKGAQNLKDEELLAILLGTGIEGKNVMEVARQILGRHSKKRLLKMKYEDLSKIKGIGPAKACIILAAQELVKRALKIQEETLPIIHSVKDVIAQAVYMREKTREHLIGSEDSDYKETIGKVWEKLNGKEYCFRWVEQNNIDNVIGEISKL